MHRSSFLVRLTQLLPFVVLIALTACGKKKEPGVGSPPSPSEPTQTRTPRLYAELPSVVVVGEPTELAVVPLTDIGTPSASWQGNLTVTCDDPSFQRPFAFEPNGEGALVLRPVTFFSPGVHRVIVKSADGLEAIAGPVLAVSSEDKLRARPGENPRRILWGDVHGHSDVGDGANSPDVYFQYARDYARIDFTSLSEHDFQQYLEVGLDQDSTGWGRIRELASKWRRPGFAVLLGWEWSSREFGHRVVLFPDDRSRWVSYREAATPAELAKRVQGTGAISILAHPKGSELTPAIAWDQVVPGFDVAVEIYSGHGGMDEDENFRPTSRGVPGTEATQAIARDLPLAFVAFSDTHLSTPGNPFAPAIRDAPYPGGLTALWATGSTEAEVFDALRARRAYATSGEKFIVDFRVANHSPGESVPSDARAALPVRGLVAAAVSLRRVEVMANLQVAKALEARGKPEIELTLDLDPFDKPTAIWLRGESEAGERFWTTPIWVGGEALTSR